VPGRRSPALTITLSIIPLVVFVAMIVAALALESSGVDPESVGMIGGLVFDLTFLPMWIYTMVKAIKNRALSRGRRVVWTIALFFLGLLTMPVYWIIEGRIDLDRRTRYQ
jgi:Na+/H+ antiporter NhaD/arsenite permease-like protein